MSPDLSPLLTGGVVLPRLAATSRKQVLCDLAGALAEKAGLDQRDVFEAIMERERLGSTGVGSGVAIPHARLSKLTETVGGFARLSQAVEFDAVDDKPCDLIFMLLAPDASGADHLRALARVSRAFRQPEFRQALRDAKTDAELKALLMTPGSEAATNAA